MRELTVLASSPSSRRRSRMRTLNSSCATIGEDVGNRSPFHRAGIPLRYEPYRGYRNRSTPMVNAKLCSNRGLCQPLRNRDSNSLLFRPNQPTKGRSGFMKKRTEPQLARPSDRVRGRGSPHPSRDRMAAPHRRSPAASGRSWETTAHRPEAGPQSMPTRALRPYETEERHVLRSTRRQPSRHQP